MIVRAPGGGGGRVDRLAASPSWLDLLSCVIVQARQILRAVFLRSTVPVEMRTDLNSYQSLPCNTERGQTTELADGRQRVRRQWIH